MKAIYQTITNSKMTPKGAQFYIFLLRSGGKIFERILVWRLTSHKNIAIFHTIANSKMNPEGSNLNNPRLQSGVPKNLHLIVWRLICALTNKMTNYTLTPLHLTR